MTDEEFAFEENVDFMQKTGASSPVQGPPQRLPVHRLEAQGIPVPETCHLSNADKEMIGLVVSSTNGCNYCLTTHSDVLRGLTGDPVWVDQLTYNYRSAKLTKKQRALCDYAYFVTVYPREITEKQVEDLREAGFNDHEILEAAFVAGYFNYTNRWVSTIDPVANPGHNSHNR